MDIPNNATAPDAASTLSASPAVDLDLPTAWQEGWTLTFLGVLSDGSNRVELTRVATTPVDQTERMLIEATCGAW